MRNITIYTLHKKIIRVMESRQQMWAGHVVFMGETKHTKFSIENM
jgi:hypothetical protein